MKSHIMSPSAVERAVCKVIDRVPLTSIPTVVESASTVAVIAALKRRGTNIYIIKLGDMRLITPSGASHRLKGIWPGNPGTSDVLISAGTFFNSKGGLYIRSARTARFISGLKKRGFFNLGTLLQIGISSPEQRCDRYDVRSKYAFTADTVIGPDGELPLSKYDENVVLPEKLFRLLLAGFPSDKLPDIDDAISECYGKTRRIINEELRIVDAQELGIDSDANPNQQCNP